jgi:type III secretion protein L
VSKKFFSLIKKGSIHIAPQTKVVPAEEFSTLMAAQEVLTEVHADAEDYRLQIAEECENLKDQAQKEGFQAGFIQWAEKMAELEGEIQKVRQDLEKMLVPVALKAAKKIVGREIELSEETIVDIVSNALKAVAQHKKVTIYVNKKDLAVLDAHRSRIKQLFEGLEALSIRERSDISPGGCVIETEGGIINAQIENQWRVLEKAFENLMLAKKESHS